MKGGKKKKKEVFRGNHGWMRREVRFNIRTCTFSLPPGQQWAQWEREVELFISLWQNVCVSINAKTSTQIACCRSCDVGRYPPHWVFSWKQWHSSYHLLTVISACFFCFVSLGLLALKSVQKGGEDSFPQRAQERDHDHWIIPLSLAIII